MAGRDRSGLARKVDANKIPDRQSSATKSSRIRLPSEPWRDLNLFRIPGYEKNEIKMKNRFIVIVIFFSCTLHCVAQEETPGTPTPSPSPYSPQTLGELKKLQQAALASDYAYRQVAHLSNNIGPRLTGSAQAQKAVEYVAAELEALGLEV